MPKNFLLSTERTSKESNRRRMMKSKSYSRRLLVFKMSLRDKKWTNSKRDQLISEAILSNIKQNTL